MPLANAPSEDFGALRYVITHPTLITLRSGKCQAIIPSSTLSVPVRTSSRFSGRNPPACIFHNL